jgi:hypothetical protein
MGGALAVTIVDPDGVWHKMDRWTNPTPWHFTDTRFLNGDPAILKPYLDTWYRMVKEYDDFYNGVVGAAEPNMSEVYCNPEYSSRDLVAPSEYGLVFLDIPNKRFWHMQGYSTYHHLDTLKIVRETRDWDDPAWTIDQIAEERLHYESLLPRIETHQTPLSRTKLVDVEVRFASVNELIEHATQMANRKHPRGDIDWSYYILNLPGWDYRPFQMDADAALQFKTALEGIGYQFNQRELDRWNEWISRDDD